MWVYFQLHKRNVILVALVLIWCWVQTLLFLAYAVSPFLPTPSICVGFPCPTGVINDDSLAYVLPCWYASIYVGMEGDHLFHRILIIKYVLFCIFFSLICITLWKSNQLIKRQTHFINDCILFCSTIYLTIALLLSNRFLLHLILLWRVMFFVVSFLSNKFLGMSVWGQT